MNTLADDTDENRRVRRKTLGVRYQPITAHELRLRAQDRTQVPVVGGAVDDHCTNLTTLIPPT